MTEYKAFIHISGTVAAPGKIATRSLEKLVEVNESRRYAK